MPRGIPKNRENGKAISKMEAVRRTLADLGPDAKPADIQKHVKDKFGIGMEMNMVSNYKSHLRTTTKKTTRGHVAPTKTAPGITLQDVQVVKELVGKLGVDQVRELAQVLSK